MNSANEKAVLRIGIVGSGFIAGKHADNLLKREQVKIVAVTDVIPNKATEFIEKRDLKEAKAYQEFDAMLEAESLDALYFCVPPFAHKGEVEKAAEKGIHVFLEKPIAMDAQSASSMVEAIERHGVVSQVGFHMRFLKGVRELKKLIDEDVVGKPLLMTGRYWANFQGSSWWRDLSRSGGQVYEQVCHIYDVARFFLGEPKTVHGAVANLNHGSEADYTVEDTSSSLIVFDSGAMATITGSNCSLPDRYIGDFKIVCQRGQLDFDSEGDWRVKDVSKITIHDGSEIREVREIVEDGDPYGDETDDFLKAIRLKNTATQAPAREGLNTISLVERVRDYNSMYVAFH